MKLLNAINMGIIAQQARIIPKIRLNRDKDIRWKSSATVGVKYLFERKRRIAILGVLATAVGVSVSYNLYLYSNRNDATVIFILGGPGSGKGTQSSIMAEKFNATHLSAGELLRKAQKDGSEHSELIDRVIKSGQIAPHEITISLLKKEIDKNPRGLFIIDGFPRKIDQALEFEQKVCRCSTVLFYECPDEVMVDRLMQRAKHSNRVDDNIYSIKLRFKTYKEVTLPVIEYYDKLGLVQKISCIGTIEDVYKRTVEACSAVFEKHNKKLS